MSLLVTCAVALSVPTVTVARAESSASWTIMVYLDGDNNLDSYAHMDMAEMEAVGSSAAVNVIVLMDEYDGPAHLLKVVAGGTEAVSGSPLDGIEVNMGDGATLATFVDFVTTHFPADHYLLDLWDHGDDYRGFAWDEHPYADGSPGSDFMTHTEIVNALTGHHLDILAIDGCVMSNLEVSYEYAARGLSIDYMVASEIYIPGQGFAYDGILAPLVADPSMGALDLAKVLVDSYMAYYNKGGWQVGLSVVAMSAVPDLVSAVYDLASAFEADMPAYRDCIATGRGAGHLGWSMTGWEQYVDFPTWVTTTQACLGPDTPADALFDAVNARLGEALPYVRNTHALEVKGAGGLGVFFPGSAGTFKHNTAWHADFFLQTQFASAGWYDFLCAYWGAK